MTLIKKKYTPLRRGFFMPENQIVAEYNIYA